jgi:HlyD family secretion protein
MTRANWLGMVFGGTVLAGMTAWGFHATPEVQVERALVTAGAITRRVVATGTVQAVTTVEVGSQVSGIVQSLDVDFNSMVRAGQVVARLNPELYAAQLQQARAARDQAEANSLGFKVAVEDAQTKLARAEALGAQQLVAPADLDAARIAMDEARADAQDGEAAVAQANAAVAQAAANLDHTVIRSPIDGIVIDRDVDVGQTLAASMQSPVLFRIASNLAHVQVQVDIDESDVGGLTLGEPATFEVESYPAATFHGTVTQLRLQPVAEQTTIATAVATSTASQASSVVATVVSYTAIIDVANPDERLRPGMTAEVGLAGSRRQSAVRIPNGALAFRPPPEVLRALGESELSASDAETTANDSSTRPLNVWKYDGKRFTPVAVHVGLADNQWTELLSGAIRPGDALVTSSVLRQRSRM